MKAKRRQLLTVIGLVALGLVVGLAGLLLAVQPQKSKAHDLDAQIADLQTKLVSLHAGPRRGPAIRAADLFQLARAMPDATDMPGIVLELARASASSHVTLASITPAAPKIQTNGSTVVPIRVDVSGKWSEVAAFLRTLRLEVRVHRDKLKVDGRLLVVDNVQLAAGADSAEVAATLNVNAFIYGVPAPPIDTTSTSTTQTTTTSSSGSVQAAGAPGSTG